MDNFCDDDSCANYALAHSCILHNETRQIELLSNIIVYLAGQWDEGSNTCVRDRELAEVVYSISEFEDELTFDWLSNSDDVANYLDEHGIQRYHKHSHYSSSAVFFEYQGYRRDIF